MKDIINQKDVLKQLVNAINVNNYNCLIDSGALLVESSTHKIIEYLKVHVTKDIIVYIDEKDKIKIYNKIEKKIY